MMAMTTSSSISVKPRRRMLGSESATNVLAGYEEPQKSIIAPVAPIQSPTPKIQNRAIR